MRVSTQYVYQFQLGVIYLVSFVQLLRFQKKLVRNLSPSEIISQIILCKDFINDWSTQKNY